MQQDSSLDALERAIKRCDVIAVRAWLESGGDVNAADRAYRTPMTMAASSGDSAIVGVLFAAGADPNERWPDWSTPLALAAMSGSVRAVRVLLDHGAKPSVEGWPCGAGPRPQPLGLRPVSERLRQLGHGDKCRILRLIDQAYALSDPPPNKRIEQNTTS